MKVSKRQERQNEGLSWKDEEFPSVAAERDGHSAILEAALVSLPPDLWRMFRSVNGFPPREFVSLRQIQIIAWEEESLE